MDNYNKCTQDEKGRWWYSFPCGTRKQYYERKCKCGKIDIVDKKHLNKNCKSCTLQGCRLSNETKNKIAMSHISMKASAEARKKMSEFRKGENHPQYKGRVRDNMGYIRIYQPEHPNATKAGYVLEHRLVMEDIISRPLKPDEIVHHINGTKDDNRRSNLWLFENNNIHMEFHRNSDIFAKKANYIYLAGAISSNPETYKWREDFEFLMRKEVLYKKIVVVNPCRNAFNQSINGYNGDGMEFIKEAKKRSQRILRSKDRQLIKICNLVIVDLALYEPEKPLIGTLMELTWAHDVFYMPIISITRNVENAYTTHPWIDECCSAKVETVEEAAEMVKTFFLDY